MFAKRKHFLGQQLKRVTVLEEPEVPVVVKAQSVDLFDDGVVIHWMFPGPNPDWAHEARADEHRPEIGLRDDCGTEYRDAWSGSSGGDGSFRGETAFVPAVPKGAAMLEITGLPYSLSVTLR